MKNQNFEECADYFRDKDYSLSKGGDYEPESPQHAAKLDQLRDRLRQSEFPVVEDYPSPESLAERVREDLLKVIEDERPFFDQFSCVVIAPNVYSIIQ